MAKKGLTKKERESLINSFSTPEYKQKNRLENQKKFERLLEKAISNIKNNPD